jgi:hypothetical protein
MILKLTKGTLLHAHLKLCLLVAQNSVDLKKRFNRVGKRATVIFEAKVINARGASC